MDNGLSMVYLVNATPRQAANPSGMQNLQHLYGLDSLASSVARVDAHGTKIAANKLNKTYKKQILDLGLPGSTEIPKNKFFMDGLFSGLAQADFQGSGGYRQFTDQELREGFSLRPGELNGYIKYRPPSPAGPKRISTPGTSQPDFGSTTHREGSGGGSSSVTYARTARSQSEGRTYHQHSRSHVATPSPPTTRSSAHVATQPESDEGNESSDDGSRFKQLEKERKRKLRLKREAEMALGGDHKRRRYDIDGYEFLDSD